MPTMFLIAPDKSPDNLQRHRQRYKKKLDWCIKAINALTNDSFHSLTRQHRPQFQYPDSLALKLNDNHYNINLFHTHHT